jgi:hypothetical protein
MAAEVALKSASLTVGQVRPLGISVAGIACEISRRNDSVRMVGNPEVGPRGPEIAPDHARS